MKLTVQEVLDCISSTEVKLSIAGEFGGNVKKELIMIIQPSADNGPEEHTEEVEFCPECGKLWYYKVLDHGTSVLKTTNTIKAVAAYNKI